MHILLIPLFTIISSLLSAEAQVQPPKQQSSPKILGGGNYGAETLESLQVSGLAKLNGTTITNDLHITGSLISLYAHLNHFEIIGEANLTDTKVDKEGSIIGSIQAVRSTFLQKLNLLTQKAVFTNCKIQSLAIRQDNAFKGKQVLELKQGTIVNGSIVFEGGKGEILLYPGSQILGSVTGAKVIRK
jgi:hypothetical protein